MLFGLCAAAALPPFYILPLLVPAFAGLFLLVHHAASRRQAFMDGWWWGLGHFTAGLYWICISLYVEPEKFAWLTPFALFGLPSVLGVYTGLVTALLYSIRVTCHVSRATLLIVKFAALWVLVEYLRSYLFTGFPWNLIGYVWTASDATLQLASVTGIYGLSWLTVIIATMPALFLIHKEQALLPTVLSAALLVSLVLFGCWSLSETPTQYTGIKMRIVQGNVPERAKWNPETDLAGLKKYADLTRSSGLDAVQVVIWPETAVPFIVQPDSSLVRELGSLLPAHALMLTGGLRGEGSRERWQAWNSLFGIDAAGNITAQYDKHHLVPFGEFIPLRGILPVENISGGHGDFARGPGPQTLTGNSIPPFSPLICYEAIFPNEATDKTGRAEWLLNVTNDAWFGTSSGPYQHLQMARTRAVEQGLPLVRAANTGISAVFDAKGRLLSSLPLEKEGVMDLYLPKAEQSRAIFSRYPYITILFIIALSAVFAGIARKSPYSPS